MNDDDSVVGEASITATQWTEASAFTTPSVFTGTPLERMKTFNTPGGGVLLDGENIGFSFGQMWSGFEKFYHADGVRKAARYFSDLGRSVWIVTRRPEQFFADEADIPHFRVLRYHHDDIATLQNAFKNRFQVVSNDKFRDHLQTLTRM